MKNVAYSNQSQNTTTARNTNARAITIDMQSTLREMSGSELLWVKASSNAKTGELVDQEHDRRTFAAIAQRFVDSTPINLEALRKALEQFRNSKLSAAAV